MTNKRPPRQHPIDWDVSHWEQALWRPHETFRPILDLIDKVALAYNREQFVNETVPLPQAIQMAFTVGHQGRLSIGDVQTSDRRAAAFAHAVQRAMRELARQEAARVIRQADVPDDGGSKHRKIVVRWDRQRLSTAAQIKKLHRAVQFGSAFKVEVAWFGLTPRAHDYLSAGYEIARRRGDLIGYAGEIEVPATIIPVPMLAPDILEVILPYAVRAVSMAGRRPMLARDEALAEILRIFTEVTGNSTTSARRGDHDGPVGSGADFVRKIEAIFGTELMPKGSTHAIARAKKRMAKPRN
jgi:hypothetical protein